MAETGSNQADINWFRSHTGKYFTIKSKKFTQM